MVVRIGLVLAGLLALLDLQDVLDPGRTPVVVTVSGAVLGIVTLLAVLAYRRAPGPAVVAAIVSRVLDAVLTAGGLVAGHAPAGVRAVLWILLGVTAVTVGLLGHGLARHVRVTAVQP